jgi:hypothetical protein
MGFARWRFLVGAFAGTNTFDINNQRLETGIRNQLYVLP